MTSKKRNTIISFVNKLKMQYSGSNVLLLGGVLDQLDAMSLARVASITRHSHRGAVEDAVQRRAALRGRLYNESTDSDCAICLASIEDEEESIFTTCCGKQFHTRCLGPSHPCA